MTVFKLFRQTFASILILCGASAIFAFGLWQSLLAGLSPDGSITPQSWLVLRIMMISLLAPGLALLWLERVKAWGAGIHTWLSRLTQTQFLVYTFSTAAVLRIIAAVLMPLRLVSDFGAYDELARLMATTGEYIEGTHPTAYFPPGWPFFLSLIYRVFGHEPQFGIVANILFGVAIVLLTWQLVRKIWGELPARWAALLVALLPSEILFANILGSESLFAFLLLSALILLIPGRVGETNVARVFTGGVLLGFATLTRSLTLFLPVVIALVYFAHFRFSKQFILHTLACVAGLLLVVTPWIVRNQTTLGRATISTNSGVNLYVGNNPNSGVGFNMPDPTVLHLRSAADEAHDDSAGYANAIAYIRERPLAFLARGVPKSTYLLTSDTDALFYELGQAAESDRINGFVWFAILVQSCWFLFMLGAGIGVYVFLRSSPMTNASGMLLVGVILYWIAVHFVYFATGRFHMPIVPVLAAFAGLAMTRIAPRNS